MLLCLLVPLAHAITLDDAWAAALQRGTQAQLARESFAAEKTVTGAAWSLVSPKLVLRGNYTLNDKELAFDTSAMIPESLAPLIGETEPVIVQNKEYFDANFSVVQPLFSGKAVPLLKAAYAGVDAAREDLRANEAKVKSGVAQAYWGVLVAREGVAIAERALESARKHRELAEKSAEVGLAAPTVKLQAQIAQSRAERDLAKAVEGRVTAETALANLTGLDAGSAVELPPARTLPWKSAEEVMDAARGGRPALRAADSRVRAASLASTARALDWLPDVNGRFTYVWTENTSAFNDRPEFWMVVVEGEWVLWDGGYRLSKQAEAAAQKRMAVLAQDLALADTDAEIQVRWEAWERAGRSVATVETELRLAEENLRLAEVAWEAGSITFLELEDARLGAAASRWALVEERMHLDLAAIGLLESAGGL